MGSNALAAIIEQPVDLPKNTQSIDFKGLKAKPPFKSMSLFVVDST